MKKLLVALVLLVLMATLAGAAGTIDQSGGWKELGVGSGVFYKDIVYTDDGAGISASISVPQALLGKLPFKVVHDPGTPAFTAASDIVISWYGQDVFGGGLLDLSNSVNTDCDFDTYAPIDTTLLLFTLSGNSVAGAKGTVRLYIM